VLITLLLALTQAAPDSQPARRDTAVYETPALRALIAEAASMNRRVPAALGGYRARLESEISVGSRRSEGMEMAVSIEQVASTLIWDRTGAYEQVIDGYRSQSIGASFASIGFFRSGWAIPSLYGNRIALLFGRDTSEAAERRRRRRRNDGEPLFAVHPLADDREGYYRFAGGDTIITMRVGDREIPIVRVEVSLRPDVPAKSVVFLGELDLDASRRHIVRLRGYFAVVGGRKRRFDLLRQAGLQGIAFVEAVNAEADGAYWLPSHQRFEAHATSNTVGDGRAIFRIVTRFIDREILPTPAHVTVGSSEDTLAIRPFRLSIQSPDSISSFRGWTTNLGDATAEVSAEDFNDVAPDRWSTRGPRRFSVETERLGDVIRLDRVQGVFTGLGGVLRFRDDVPGLTMRAAAGYAWSEQTVRGRFVVEHRRGRTQSALRVQRSLDLTNDFRNPYDSGSTIGALLGSDNYDYVDRRSASVQLRRFLRHDSRGSWRLEAGVADDHNVRARLERSPVGLGRDFRPNRLVSPGTYVKSAATLDWRPDVTLEFLRTGLGARLHYERGDGGLPYQRGEVRLTARTNRGPLAFGARLDAGVTSPDAPPQQLFELGRNQNLPGYDYKEFAGDQAVVLRGLVLLRLPFLSAPIMITPRFWLPPAAPSLALGVQSGWARASTAGSLATVTALGSVPTGHPRASASATLRFFGGAVGVGAARPLDYPGKWRWIVEFGQRP
jgi:hypothetical protein